VPALPGSGKSRRAQAPRGWGWRALPALALVAVTLLAYHPALRDGMVWDDDYQIFENRFIHAPDGLRHFWLTASASDYFPLNSTVHWIEWRLWGADPAGYHAVNIALHAGAALVLWQVLVRLAVPAPLAAAALFAVHPVTVASVAWISELKNVLSLFLAALSLLAYLRFEEDGRRRWYATALATFTLALLAKTSVVMLPALFLLLAWYRRSRVTIADVRRSVPFFVLALVLGLVTVYHQHHNGIGSVDVRPEGVASRLAATGWAVWFYLWKDLLPLDLSMIYPRWQVDPHWLPAWGPLVGLVAVAVVAWRYRAGWGRPALVMLGAFVIMLAPVLGLIAMSFHRHSLVSDHLQYVALIAPIALAAGGAATALRRFAGKGTAALVTIVALVVLSALTWQRTRVFESEWTLWADTLAKNPRAWGAHDNLGYLLYLEGKPEEAVRQHREALRLEPDAPEPHNNLGRALAALGQYDEAETEYAEAIRLEPGLADPHNNLALALAKHGDVPGAERHYAAALALDPDYPEAHNNFALLLASEGRDDDAEAQFRRALAAKPAYVEAHSNLGYLLVRRGRTDEGMAHMMTAVRLAPDRAELHSNLGIALAAQGKHAEAIGEYAEALRLEPSLAQPHFNMGTALLQLRRFTEAAAQYREALRIDPTLQAARQNLEVALQLASEGRSDDGAR
jgi:Flp pilus assembly protein TadD